MELVVWFIVRTVLGVSLASVLGVVGFFAGWMLWYPALGPSLGIVFRVCGGTIGGGLGAFLGWLRPEDARAITVATFGLALLGGLAGTWGGHLYGVATYEAGLGSRATHVSTVMGAAVGSNTILVLINIYWVGRRHRKI